MSPCNVILTRKEAYFFPQETIFHPFWTICSKGRRHYFLDWIFTPSCVCISFFGSVSFLWFQSSFLCSFLFMPSFVSHVFQYIVREVGLKTFRRGTSIARAWVYVGWYSSHYRAAVWSWDEVRLTPRYQRSMPAACHDPVWDEFSMAVHVNNNKKIFSSICFG
jgi:hypothetical protein